jgi:hypothetical protein
LEKAAKIGLNRFENWSKSMRMLNPAFLILIASSIPALRSCLQTSHESNYDGEKVELGLMHRTYLGADFFSV